MASLERLLYVQIIENYIHQILPEPVDGYYSYQQTTDATEIDVNHVSLTKGYLPQYTHLMSVNVENSLIKYCIRYLGEKPTIIALLSDPELQQKLREHVKTLESKWAPH